MRIRHCRSQHEESFRRPCKIQRSNFTDGETGHGTSRNAAPVPERESHGGHPVPPGHVAIGHQRWPGETVNAASSICVDCEGDNDTRACAESFAVIPCSFDRHIRKKLGTGTKQRFSTPSEHRQCRDFVFLKLVTPVSDLRFLRTKVGEGILHRAYAIRAIRLTVGRHEVCRSHRSF